MGYVRKQFRIWWNTRSKNIGRQKRGPISIKDMWEESPWFNMQKPKPEVGVHGERIGKAKQERIERKGGTSNEY